jgi:hypothetical protein
MNISKTHPTWALIDEKDFLCGLKRKRGKEAIQNYIKACELPQVKWTEADIAELKRFAYALIYGGIK